MLSLLVVANTIPISTAFAQSTAPSPTGNGGNIDISPTAAPRFNCGPHLITFRVKEPQGTSIRCVKLSEGRPGNPRIPQFAWYGEYNLPGGTWSNPVEIKVTGALTENWQRVDSVPYKPLPKLIKCGRYFQEYKVSDLVGRRTGSGLRCILNELPESFDFRLPLAKPVTTWFGNGYWGRTTNTYSHLGTFSHNGYGASDICGLDPTCNTFGWGSLKFTIVPDGFDVTGAWSEKWRR
ncbi:MAG: hypothetical protein KME60_26540 [Cyanomargarita calcarea GSE-NOS-MK-12-04C]|uniref:Secreted protein n=1 Tax=Cyanomargarita calcarea GSE-NOS-MK-12-04C TaxID=2839659 RepID=A0A951QR06_9CYAN|nr:hypothetical protein [Cyanomargarita calcarea GSE-NOS-MK-12-04C]